MRDCVYDRGESCGLTDGDIAPSPGTCRRCHHRAPQVGAARFTPLRVVDYVRAEVATAVSGDVPVEISAAREAACRRCRHLAQNHDDPDPIGYCNACACGSQKRAALSRKVTMRNIRRPKGCLWPPDLAR